MFSIERYDPSVIYEGQQAFDCGHAVVTGFARKLKDRVKGNMQTAYVLIDEQNVRRFVGFYTIRQFSLDRGTFQNSPSLPRSVPVTHLVMLGVDSQCQGKKLGQQLMRHAFGVAKKTSQQVASYGVYLLADAGAVPFYQSLNFVFLGADQRPSDSPMFLPMASIP